jgi:pimeloyl-ACP methyl ester carboxylesterase
MGSERIRPAYGRRPPAGSREFTFRRALGRPRAAGYGAGVVLSVVNHLARAAFRLEGYESRFVSAGTGRVHVLEAEGGGALPPVALLHGLSSAGVHLWPMLRHVRGRVSRVVVPDLPGHGFSDAPAAHAPRALRDAVVDAIDAALGEPAVIFGNSLGGAAAIHYALARPERVRGLVLCSPSGAPMDEAALARFVASFDFARHADAVDFVDRLFARPNPFKHAFAWGVRRSFHDPHVRALLGSLTPDDLLRPGDLAALTMPVLLIWPRQERILPREQVAFFREHLPAHARLEEPDGLGHAPYLDDAAAIGRRLVDFAMDVASGRAPRAAVRAAPAPRASAAA